MRRSGRWPVIPYLKAVQADTLFMIAVPMVLIGLATVIAGPFLFPDETDYRVLTPLPISRAMLFGAKLVAVAAIVFAAIVAVNAVTTFWFPLAVSGEGAAFAAGARDRAWHRRRRRDRYSPVSQ